MTDPVSTEGLRAAAQRVMKSSIATADARLLARHTLAALRDTGPRPDSGIDVEALVGKLQAAPYHWNERIVHDLREVLSTPRTETSVDWTEGHGTVARPRTETSDE